MRWGCPSRSFSAFPAITAQRKTVQRTAFSISPISGGVIARQQATAERFYKHGLLPKQITVNGIVWKWTPGFLSGQLLQPQ